MTDSEDKWMKSLDRAEKGLKFLSEQILLNVQIDVERKQFMWVNPAWEYWTGWTRDQLCSKSYFDFIHPDDIESSVMETETFSEVEELWKYSFVNRYRKEDGSYLPILWTGTSVSFDETHVFATGIPGPIAEAICDGAEQIRSAL